ncbi:LysR substrate-binding domain-containing protein [Saccharopolyspora hattusasensis]|uniref:LysR substrate-binding domain-containing protein n=1 Tax=Saccharopolyspora hattusasensis TaxID=1128679 RepID=UPI003D9628F3
MELTDRIPEVLHRAERGTRAIHIGMPPGVPREWFEALQTALREARPDLRISLREATSEKQRVLLQQGVINIGLLHTEPRELQSVQVFSQRFGCAVRDASRFGERRSVMLEDLAGLRVMAHSVQESPGKETRLRAAAEARGVQIDWAFRGYWEHAELVADSAEADVVLATATSSRRHFPAWRWIPLDESEKANSVVRTWAAWLDPDLLDLEACLSAMHQAAIRTAPDTMPINTPTVE